MERFWKAALGVAGIGAVAFFVFYSLYKKWLSLPIFSALNGEQTFILMMTFLGLTFLALVAGLVAWLLRPKPELEDAALHRLEQAWNGVNYINCDKLVGPDVNRAGGALHMTALYWRNGYISKTTLLEKYGLQFCELFEQLDGCDKPVPGYTNPKKYCRDFLPASVRTTYAQINPQIVR